MNAREEIAAMKALTLRLDDETFAIEAETVREILEIVPVTRVPNAPEAVSGLINVRGSVVPLADLRVMFSMQRKPADEDSRIVVVEVDFDGERLVAGILADKVHEVVDLDGECREAVPRIGMKWPPELLRGIARHDGDFVMIPDVKKIFETLSA